MRKSHLR